MITENGEFYSEIELYRQNAGHGPAGIYDEGRKVNEITLVNEQPVHGLFKSYS